MADVHKCIKYQGSKIGLIDFLQDIIPVNKRGHYIEPFFGGGGSFLPRQPTLRDVANDYDGRVINLFKTLQDQQKELLAKIELTPMSEAVYIESLEIVADETKSNIDRAAALIVLIYQGYCGLIEKPRAKSWVKDTSVSPQHRRIYNYTIRFANVPEQLAGIAARLRAIHFHCCNHKEFMNRLEDTPDKLIYCDPPYFNTSGYQTGFTRDDHYHLLLKIMSYSNSAIAISGYTNEMYSDILCDWHQSVQPHSKRLGGKGHTPNAVEEVVWRNLACMTMKEAETHGKIL